MKTVLVTGGGGFIGSYVVEELLRRQYKVVVFDTRWRKPIEGAEVVLGDTRDATSVTEAIAHVDGVIHLAGVLGTQETITNPRPAVETNVMGGLNVLEACAQYDLPLVNIAVGNWWMNNTYSITKNTVERFCDMWGIKGPILLDPDGVLTSTLGVRGVPTNVVVDSDGTVRAFGAARLDELEQAIDDLYGR